MAALSSPPVRLFARIDKEFSRGSGLGMGVGVICQPGLMHRLSTATFLQRYLGDGFSSRMGLQLPSFQIEWRDFRLCGTMATRKGDR